MLGTFTALAAAVAVKVMATNQMSAAVRVANRVSAIDVDNTARVANAQLGKNDWEKEDSNIELKSTRTRGPTRLPPQGAKMRPGTKETGILLNSILLMIYSPADRRAQSGDQKHGKCAEM